MDKTAQINHFLITLFNLKNNHWTEQNVLDSVWFHKRIKMVSTIYDRRFIFEWIIAKLPNLHNTFKRILNINTQYAKNSILVKPHSFFRNL